MPVGQDAGVALELRLCTRGEAERVIARRRDPAHDPPWAAGYPLDGDTRACVGLHQPAARRRGGTAASSPFGYYQVLEDGVVVGGIGFHGPPSGDVGGGRLRRRAGVPGAGGWRPQALRMLLDVAAGLEGVRRVVGRTEEIQRGVAAGHAGCRHAPGGPRPGVLALRDRPRRARPATRLVRRSDLRCGPMTLRDALADAGLKTMNLTHGPSCRQRRARPHQPFGMPAVELHVIGRKSGLRGPPC